MLPPISTKEFGVTASEAADSLRRLAKVWSQYNIFEGERGMTGQDRVFSTIEELEEQINELNINQIGFQEEISRLETKLRLQVRLNEVLEEERESAWKEIRELNEKISILAKENKKFRNDLDRCVTKGVE